MSIRIRLGKELLLKLFCASCQGYRSVHRALQDGYWSAFQAYYTSDKREAVQSLMEQLHELTPSKWRDLPPPQVEDLSRITPSRGLFRITFGSWLNKRKQSWRFAVEEIRFLTSTLQRLLRMLERPEAPARDDLITLRMDLTNCSGIFEMRCYGLPELDRGRYIEHFDQTERVRHWELSEILGVPGPTAPADRPRAKAVD
jgi:hypothetical protein